MREGRAEELERRGGEPLVAAGQGRAGFCAVTQGHAPFPTNSDAATSPRAKKVQG